VLDGRRPARDPDREFLVSAGDRIRVYAQHVTRNGGRLRLCGRLVDGVWESPARIEESRAVPDDQTCWA
jgi:hypothetical protein